MRTIRAFVALLAASLFLLTVPVSATLSFATFLNGSDVSSTSLPASASYRACVHPAYYGAYILPGGTAANVTVTPTRQVMANTSYATAVGPAVYTFADGVDTAAENYASCIGQQRPSRFGRSGYVWLKGNATVQLYSVGWNLTAEPVDEGSVAAATPSGATDGPLVSVGGEYYSARSRAVSDYRTADEVLHAEVAFARSTGSIRIYRVNPSTEVPYLATTISTISTGRAPDEDLDTDSLTFSQDGLRFAVLTVNGTAVIGRRAHVSSATWNEISTMTPTVAGSLTLEKAFWFRDHLFVVKTSNETTFVSRVTFTNSTDLTEVSEALVSSDGANNVSALAECAVHGNNAQTLPSHMQITCLSDTYDAVVSYRIKEDGTVSNVAEFDATAGLAGVSFGTLLSGGPFGESLLLVGDVGWFALIYGESTAEWETDAPYEDAAAVIFNKSAIVDDDDYAPAMQTVGRGHTTAIPLGSTNLRVLWQIDPAKLLYPGASTFGADTWTSPSGVTLYARQRRYDVGGEPTVHALELIPNGTDVHVGVMYDNLFSTTAFVPALGVGVYELKFAAGDSEAEFDALVDVGVFSARAAPTTSVFPCLLHVTAAVVGSHFTNHYLTHAEEMAFHDNLEDSWTTINFTSLFADTAPVKIDDRLYMTSHSYYLIGTQIGDADHDSAVFYAKPSPVDGSIAADRIGYYNMSGVGLTIATVADGVRAAVNPVTNHFYVQCSNSSIAVFDFSRNNGTFNGGSPFVTLFDFDLIDGAANETYDFSITWDGKWLTRQARSARTDGDAVLVRCDFDEDGVLPNQTSCAPILGPDTLYATDDNIQHSFEVGAVEVMNNMTDYQLWTNINITVNSTFADNGPSGAIDYLMLSFADPDIDNEEFIIWALVCVDCDQTYKQYGVASMYVNQTDGDVLMDSVAWISSVSHEHFQPAGPLLGIVSPAAFAYASDVEWRHMLVYGLTDLYQVVVNDVTRAVHVVDSYRGFANSITLTPTMDAYGRNTFIPDATDGTVVHVVTTPLYEFLCEDNGRDPDDHCLTCYSGYNDTYTCDFCQSGRFEIKCDTLKSACDTLRCGGVGDCTGQLEGCDCASNVTGYFGETCEITNATCVEDRCSGNGACTEQLEGCECDYNFLGPNLTVTTDCSTCTKGYEGDNCTTCSTGYYDSDSSAKVVCTKESDNDLTVAASIGIAVASIAVVIFAVLGVVRYKTNKYAPV